MTGWWRGFRAERLRREELRTSDVSFASCLSEEPWLVQQEPMEGAAMYRGMALRRMWRRWVGVVLLRHFARRSAEGGCRHWEHGALCGTLKVWRSAEFRGDNCMN